MMIWSGLGILVPVIAAICIFAADSLGWPKSIFLFIGAIAVTAIGLYLNRLPGRTVIDKATGKEIVLKKKHTFFFVPVVYWGAVLAAFAVYYLFAK